MNEVGKYPDRETYKALYSRFHSGRDVAELLTRLEPLKGMRFLELCAGEGQVTRKALERGVAEALMVDQEHRMLSPDLEALPNVWATCTNIRDTLVDITRWENYFDRVVCRQGVNYWLSEETAKLLAEVMSGRGVFVFNTFNQKPPEKPRTLEYERDGHHFVEVSWLLGEEVHHLQVRDGMTPHHTSFKWISQESFWEMLKPHFHVIEWRDGKTSLYRCEKK